MTEDVDKIDFVGVIGLFCFLFIMDVVLILFVEVCMGWILWSKGEWLRLLNYFIEGGCYFRGLRSFVGVFYLFGGGVSFVVG